MNLASDQQHNALWTEGNGSLVVVFPRLPEKGQNKGCAWIFLVFAALLLLPIPLCLVMTLIDGKPRPGVVILVWTVVESIAVWLFCSCYQALRNPLESQQPSVLTIKDDMLLIERAGKRGDLNVSWQLQEIVDIRLCPTANHGDFILTFMHSPLAAMFFMKRDELVRVSVQVSSGDVEDVVFPAPTGSWIDKFELDLRYFLGLINEDGS